MVYAQVTDLPTGGSKYHGHQWTAIITEPVDVHYKALSEWFEMENHSILSLKKSYFDRSHFSTSTLLLQGLSWIRNLGLKRLNGFGHSQLIIQGRSGRFDQWEWDTFRLCLKLLSYSLEGSSISKKTQIPLTIFPYFTIKFTQENLFRFMTWPEHNAQQMAHGQTTKTYLYMTLSRPTTVLMSSWAAYICHLPQINCALLHTLYYTWGTFSTKCCGQSGNQSKCYGFGAGETQNNSFRLKN